MPYMARTCVDCGAYFIGWSNASRCPEYKYQRTLKINKDHRERKRLGLSRIMGSMGTCEMCGRRYVVNSGVQRVCPECQPAFLLLVDRKSGLDYYQRKRPELNPVRNEKRRRKTPKLCKWCKRKIPIKGRKSYCSPECARAWKNESGRAGYYAGTHARSHLAKHRKPGYADPARPGEAAPSRA